MKIGILNAFPPGEHIVNWNRTPVDAYSRFLDLVPNGFTYVGYDVARGQFPSSPTDCDAFLVTGSPKGVYDPDEWIARLLHFIRESYKAGVKLVGICFGHQILAHALGGYSEKSAKGWDLGLKSFDLTGSKPWMAAAYGNCSLYFAHQDQVVRLPPGAELLGGNSFCPNLFFVIDDQVLGIQGHPEFSAEIMDDIFSALEETVDQAVHVKAVDSFKESTPDNQLVAGWIVNFLNLPS